MFTIGCDDWPGIAKVIEETGELGQVCGKLVQMQGKTHHFSGADLKSDLEEEIADSLAAIEYLLGHNPQLDLDRINARRSKKLAKFIKWHGENNG